MFAELTYVGGALAITSSFRQRIHDVNCVLKYCIVLNEIQLIVQPYTCHRPKSVFLSEVWASLQSDRFQQIENHRRT